MKDDPVIWLTEHIIVGVHLREEAWSLRTKEEADAWEKRQLRWWEKLHEGIKCRSLRDAARVEVVDRVRLVQLPVGHPYYDEIIPVTMVWTSTGAGRAGNNPLSRHAACIERAREVLHDWRIELPAPPSEPRKKRGRPADKRATEKRNLGWADEMRRQPKRANVDVAREIAARDGAALSTETIVREARKADKTRGK